MWDFYRSLSAAEKRSVKTFGRYVVMMVTVPFCIALSLPLLLRFFSLDQSFSVVIIATSATLSVFGIATAFAYVAYYESDGQGEATAKHIVTKSIKAD
ncbi:hypothetical protein BgAZ_404350 [Babesia gibsoni]|uniref:Uncharacterized protein n=1 Tax=Babesia gibsoni TaxID=33632 RepID=A0AAD8LRR3_BABGI|nr:hypothetical protein BgAZ_404350 [Babesia gibsoni]